MAVVITLTYLLTGRLNNDDQLWARVNLPLSAASILMLGLAAAETYLYVQRVQRTQEQLRLAKEREQDLSQRLAFQRQSMFNHISRGLIDKLDLTEIPREVLEQITQLFEADVVLLWVIDKSAPSNYSLRGLQGLQSHSRTELEKIRWSFPSLEVAAADVHQLILEDVRCDASPAVAAFYARENITAGVLTPIIRRQEMVGVMGVYSRQPVTVAPPLAAEMQTVANIIAGAVQAEELYRDLIQVQKVESIGTLTSGIAHDFNNVLAAILACASHVKQQTAPSSPTYHYLEATEASAHRGAALTKQLLAFARREGPRRTVLDANECIEHTLQMLDRSLDKSILIQRQLDKHLQPIEVDPSQLEQVILNVSVNARDAMPDGGMYTLTTRNAKLDSKDPYRPALPLPDGEYVVLGFRDTGTGMDAATLKKIFQPFFTTKRAGKGTGLGLSLIQSLVKGFGGDLRVESAIGQGTLFEIFIPASAKPLPVAATDKKVTVRGGSERILLAEDEEVILEMAKLGLESKGYQVLTAPDGAAALSVYREKWREIDLVIADMVMPRMSGSELFSRMKEINPGVRVIVSSGYSHDQEGQRMLQHGCLGYLQKPYNTESLNQLVRSILDSGL